MEKSFLELYKLDITSHIKTRDVMKKNVTGEWVKDTSKPPMKYLEWSKVLILLYELGANTIKYGNVCDEKTGHPVFLNGLNTAPFVKIWVKIDQETYEITHPVLNGYEKGYADNQSHIHNATQRAFVKCVAVNTGLGLSLWERDEETNSIVPDEVLKEEILKWNIRMTNLFNAASNKLGGHDNVHAELNTNTKELKAIYDGDNVLRKQEIVDALITLMSKN